MREYVFHGKRTDNGEWVDGYLNYNQPRKQYYIMDDVNSFPIPVYTESVGQYTGMNEFVVKDGSYNKPLFEGDIVEVWSERRPEYMNPQSQYDGYVKVRAVIRFKYGKWFLDYENEYNKAICKLRGNEQTERTVTSWHELSHFQCPSNNEDRYRERNSHYKFSDIMKIGNAFDNADLLEG